MLNRASRKALRTKMMKGVDLLHSVDLANFRRQRISNWRRNEMTRLPYYKGKQNHHRPDSATSSGNRDSATSSGNRDSAPSTSPRKRILFDMIVRLAIARGNTYLILRGARTCWLEGRGT